MKKTNTLILLTAILALSLSACKKNNRFEINTNENRVEVKIKRFDNALINLDTTNMQKSLAALEKEFPEFYKEYIEQILDIDPTETATLGKLITEFKSDTVFAEVNTKVLEVFSNVTDIEKTVSDAFTYIHHYFPEVKLPEIYFFVSGFNRSVMLSNSFIGLGTDLYLGADFPLYQTITYQYLMNNMRRENVATDIVSTTLFRMFVMDSKEERLIDNMIFRGKVMYLLSVFMPNEKTENIMGYTAEQWKWCKDYEKAIWAAVIDQKHLFSTDVMTIRKYMNDAPFTAPVSQDSPGRLGTRIGWQIVESYMNRNKNVSLRDLMNENNYQRILEESGYRP